MCWTANVKKNKLQNLVGTLQGVRTLLTREQAGLSIHIHIK